MLFISTNRIEFQIDEEDLHFLESHPCVSLTWDGYVRVRRRGEKKMYRLHRLIMGVTGRRIVDHRHGDRRDLRKQNLRVCLLKQNNRNLAKTKRANTTSEYKGVSLHAQTKRWRVRIYFNRRCIELGLFDCPIEAAKIYDRAAIRYHGEFARLNFMTPTAPATLPEFQTQNRPESLGIPAPIAI